jgi:HD-GYP domain-containing protein (c-di-GMP phosphodiesterase class II)
MSINTFTPVQRRCRRLRRLDRQADTATAAQRRAGTDALVDFIDWWLGHAPLRKPSPAAAGEKHRHQSDPRDRWRWLGARPDVVSRQEMDAMVDVLAGALELRYDGTGQHARRTTELALALTRVVAPHLAEDPQLRYGFLLHDIGMIRIPDRILFKPHALTKIETRQLEQHPLLGAELVTANPFFGDAVRDVVAFHHERWDGAGYPCCLAGEQIPILARIFAIADRFETITSDRPDRAAIPIDRALSRLRSEAGHQFDPDLINHFLPLAAEHDALRCNTKRHLRVA